MTHIDIIVAEPRYNISLNGHATGSAEVCAGISALMYSLAGFLDNNQDELFLSSVRLDEPGKGSIMFELEDPSPKIKGAFELIVIGLKQIEQSYPDYCRVNIEIKK